MSPKQVVEQWVKRFNACDAAALADLYSDGATNHQVTQEPIVGKTAIKAMFEREFAAADMACMVETIHEAGEVAALEWRDPLGLRGCGFFTVQDNRITFQRGYWDKLSFLRMHHLSIEQQPLSTIFELIGGFGRCGIGARPNYAE
jgi:limonene-1,2-epoxide hydrolase